LAPQIKGTSLQTDVNQAYIAHTTGREICKEWSLKKIHTYISIVPPSDSSDSN